MTAPTDPSQVNTSTVPGFNVTEENKYTGTFVVEAFDGMIKAVHEEAESQTEYVVNIAFSAIGLASSLIEAAMDPIGTGFSILIGWVLEHFEPLRNAIQLITGKPDSVREKSKAANKLAGDMRVLADDHMREMANFSGWAGMSSENYKASMEELNKELRALASGTEAQAKVLAVVAVILALVYDEVRDMIAEALGKVASIALNIAITFLTLGGSAPSTGSAAGKAVADIGRLVVRVTDLAAKLSKAMETLGKLMAKLEDAMKLIGKGWDKIETAADVGEIGYELYKAPGTVDDDINKAIEADTAKDQANADLNVVKELGNDALAANNEYKAAKDGEAAAAKNAQAWADYLNTQGGEAKLANDALKAQVDAANAAARETEAAGQALEKAAKSGDRDAFNDAKKEYEAAKDRFESANDAAKTAEGVAKKEAADTAAAAKGYAKEAANVAAWAEVSSKELAETEDPTNAAQNASDNFQNKYRNSDGSLVGNLFNQIDDAGKMMSDAANNQARSDQRNYEAANLDAAQKNAAAAAANAKAMESGSDADIAAADAANAEAKSSGEAAKTAGQKAYESGKEAQKTYDGTKELSDLANVANGGTPAEPTRDQATTDAATQAS